MTPVMRRLLPIVALLLALGAAQAQPSAGELAEFLAPLEEHPAARAAAAGLEAARLQLSAARDPVQFELAGGYSRIFMDDLELPPGTEEPPTSAGSVSAAVTLRPFPFGDIRDLVDQREIALAQAHMDYLDTLTGLQAQAVEAALGVQLAQEGAQLAEQGVELAREAFESTRLRFERGAATQRDLREAESGLAEAHNMLADAETNRELAAASLEMLVGSSVAPDLLELELPAPAGTPLQVVRSQLQLRMAELAPRGAQRNLYPTAQVSYSHNIGEKASVSVSVESRTLQPNVGYDYQSPGRSFPESEMDGTFQVGVSMNISPGALNELDAAKAQREAAELGLEAAKLAADVQFRSLRSALEQSARSLALAQRRVADAQESLAETRSRVDAGLSVPLELQNAALAVTQAQLDLLSERQRVQQSILDLYTYYALPLTSAPEATR